MKFFSGQEEELMPDDVAHTPHAMNQKWWHFKSESMKNTQKAVCTKEDEACEWATD